MLFISIEPKVGNIFPIGGREEGKNCFMVVESGDGIHT
jgi:hypothetical protein